MDGGESSLFDLSYTNEELPIADDIELCEVKDIVVYKIQRAGHMPLRRVLLNFERSYIKEGSLRISAWCYQVGIAEEDESEAYLIVEDRHFEHRAWFTDSIRAGARGLLRNGILIDKSDTGKSLPKTCKHLWKFHQEKLQEFKRKAWAICCANLGSQRLM